jgi:hypothetical protein
VTVVLGVAVNVIEDDAPEHIVAFPLMLAVASGFTVMTALPVISAPMAVQFASERAVTVYVVVAENTGANWYGEDVIPFTTVELVPSEYVRFQGCVPVNAIETVVDEPLQIVVVPEINDVGLGLTLNVTFCVKDCEQFGEALVVVMPVICSVCPLFAEVRLAEVKLAAPPPSATTPVIAVWAAPFIE